MTKSEKRKKTTLALIICALAALASSVVLVFDADLLWHYKVGEEIVRNTSLSIHDTFSWQTGLIWSQHEWLYDILVYIVLKYTGMIGFWILFGLNWFVIYWCGMQFNTKGYSVRCLAYYAMFSTVFMWISPLTRFNRPAELSIWFYLLVIYMYHTNFKHKRLIYFFVGCLTANFHGGSLLVTLVSWGIMIGVDLIYDLIERKKLTLKSDLLCVALFIMGSFINPLGIRQIPSLLKVGGMESTELIQEWIPFSFEYIQAVPYLLILLSIGYNICKNNFTRNCVRISALLCALMTLSLVSVKGTLYFAVVYIIFAYNFMHVMMMDFRRFVVSYNKSNREFAEQYTRHQNLKQKLQKIEKVTLPALISVVVFISIQFDISNLKTFEEMAYDYKPGMQETIAYIKENIYDNGEETGTRGKKTEADTGTREKADKSIKDGTLIHGYMFGNYMIWNNMKCFIDTRQTPYEPYLGINTNESLHDYVELVKNIGGRDKVTEILGRYNAGYVVTEKEFNLDWYFEDNEQWELVFYSQCEKEDDGKDGENENGDSRKYETSVETEQLTESEIINQSEYKIWKKR